MHTSSMSGFYFPDVLAEDKYWGAAAVGTTVYFAPFQEDNVGVLDTITNTFSTISTAAAGVTADYKYGGAVAVGTRVYFGPFSEDNVGVLTIQVCPMV